MRWFAKGAASARPGGCASWADGGSRRASCPASGLGPSWFVPGWPAVALAASVCRHARWVGMLYCWLVYSPARFLRMGWARRWGWCFCPLWGTPHFLPGVHRGLLALWLGWRCGRRGCVARRLRRLSGMAFRHRRRPGPVPGPAERGASAGTSVCAGSGPGPGSGAGRPGDEGSMGRTAGPAGGAWSRWDAGSACAGAYR